MSCVQNLKHSVNYDALCWDEKILIWLSSICFLYVILQM